MAQYIPKDALVAKIESKRKYAQTLGDNAINSSMQQFYDGMKQGCVDIMSSLDTLEVKEVDLEKELIEWHKEHFKKDGTFIEMSGFYLTNNSQMDIAKHFFELGLKASNPLTWEDIRDILDLYDEVTSMDYCSDIYEEVLKRFKTQKGE